MTRQGQILQVIERYIAVHGCSPSNREIAAAAGFRSPSTVLRYLQQLKADGYVTYQPRVPRTIQVLRPTPASHVPDPNQVVWVPIRGHMPREMAAAREELCFLPVAGDAAAHPGVRPGDWMVVRRPPEHPDHSTVVAVLHQVQPLHEDAVPDTVTRSSR